VQGSQYYRDNNVGPEAFHSSFDDD